MTHLPKTTSLKPAWPPGRTTRRRALAAAAGLAMLACTGAQAQAWPQRPIKIVVPLAAGSTADIVSRAVGNGLATRLGQPVVIENKPGAGGTIAMAELARSAPDGYTISFASQGTLVFNQALYKNPRYDSLKDFAPIVLVGGVSNVMVVPSESPFRSPAQVIAAARTKPGGLTFSSGGSGTSHHLSGVLFGQMTKTELQHVPYKGAPQGIVAVMSGEVQVAWYNTPTVISQIKAGKLRALAVTSKQPSPLLPDVPPLQDSGVPGYELNTWFGFVAPTGTPRAVVMRLNEAISEVLADPAVRKNLAEQGFDLSPRNSPEDFAALVRDEMAKWTPVVKASGATVD